MIEPKLFKNLYNLEHRIKKTYDFNLKEYKEFLKDFNNPQNQIGRIIHIAGTNGKGSVTEMLASVLISAGFRVGVYTSPHISEVNERIKVDNKQISDKDFSRIERMIYKKITGRETSYRTYFEALTALAFIYFKERKTDFAVIETGLGGRLDSTNVVESEISIITKIGLDHTDILGKTLKKIAFEKAGIIKKSQDVFTFKQNKDVIDVIKRAAEKTDSKLHIVDSSEIIRKTKDSFLFEQKTYTLNQPGSYQKENATLVIKVSENLEIKLPKIRMGLKNFVIEGRLETVNQKPMIILDGSHNPQAVEVTLKEVKNLFPKKRLTVISIFMADKDYKKSINLIKKYSDRVIITQIPFFRCAKKEDYKGMKIEFAENVKIALMNAVDERTDIILFTGSFYLIAEAREEVKKLFPTSRIHKSF